MHAVSAIGHIAELALVRQLKLFSLELLIQLSHSLHHPRMFYALPKTIARLTNIIYLAIVSSPFIPFPLAAECVLATYHTQRTVPKNARPILLFSILTLRLRPRLGKHHTQNILLMELQELSRDAASVGMRYQDIRSRNIDRSQKGGQFRRCYGTSVTIWACLTLSKAGAIVEKDASKILDLGGHGLPRLAGCIGAGEDDDDGLGGVAGWAGYGREEAVRADGDMSGFCG